MTEGAHPSSEENLQCWVYTSGCGQQLETHLAALCTQLTLGAAAKRPNKRPGCPHAQKFSGTVPLRCSGQLQKQMHLVLLGLLHFIPAHTLSASYFKFISPRWQFSSPAHCLLWCEALVIYLALFPGKLKILHFEIVSPETVIIPKGCQELGNNLEAWFKTSGRNSSLRTYLRGRKIYDSHLAGGKMKKLRDDLLAV